MFGRALCQYRCLGLILLALPGCQSLSHPAEKRPETLFAWEVGGKSKDAGKDADKHASKNADHDSNEDAGAQKKQTNGKTPQPDDLPDSRKKSANSKQKENGSGGTAESNSQAESSSNERSKLDKPLVTDRPDFTEASSTVGLGVVQLEGGYTFSRDRQSGITTQSHSYPETLLRVGVFAEWFELRLGQNFATERTAGKDVSETLHGAEDLYLGVKLALAEQKKWLPELGLILQANVPTGADVFSADRVLPGINFLFGWELIEDTWTLGGSLQANQAVDDLHHTYLETAQSLTMAYFFTQKFGVYTEWFAFYPSGALAADITPQHYLNGGLYYRVTKDFQLDARAGVGLNRHSQDFFVGTGFAVRF
jgi:hypothetical protein